MENKKSNIIFIISFTLLIISLICLFLTGASSFIGVSGLLLVSVLLSLILKNKTAVFFIYILSFMRLLSPPFWIETNSLWRYPVQRAFTGIYHNVKEPDYFPDLSEINVDDFHFRYMPGFGQATGFYSIEFITDHDTAQRFADMYSSKAEYIIPLKEYDNRYEIKDFEKQEGSVEDGTLIVYVGDIWENDRSGEIYVLDAVLYWNHPHSSAVIIDVDSGRVQFTYM